MKLADQKKAFLAALEQGLNSCFIVFFDCINNSFQR